jgi:hypothetical protein
MLQVSELQKTLVKNNVNSSQGRQCLFNYLCSFCDREELILPETIDRFFQACFDFIHWQQNPQELSRAVKEGLKLCGVDLNESKWSGFRWPETYQVIDVIQTDDTKELIEQYLKDYYQNGQQFRVIKESSRKFLIFILDHQNNLTVKMFDSKFMIHKGRLEPLKKDNSLFFNSSLELQPDLDQKMELSPYLYSRFKIRENKVSGGMIRGYMFQKYQEFKSTPLNELPRLFYSLKRIEQFAVHRDTDAFYQGLISELETHSKNLRQIDPDSIKIFPDLLVRAQNAFEYVYLNDRLLGLMIKELQSAYSQAPNTLSTDSLRFAKESPFAKDDSWQPADSTN